jgi:flavin-dependent dehydrogenase
MNQTHDVLVVGGGPAGSAMSIELARLGRSAVLVERSRRAPSHWAEHLPPEMRGLLQTVTGDADSFTEPHQRSPGTSTSWGSPTISYRDYIFDPYGCGYQVDRGRFDRDFRRAARTLGVTVLEGVRVVSVVRERDGRLTVAFDRRHGRTHDLVVRLVADATGRASAVARRLGARRELHDHLLGIGARIQNSHRSVHGERLVLESVAGGWWYACPMPDHSVAAVFMTDPDLMRRSRQTSEQIWRAEIEKTHLIRSMLPEVGERHEVMVRSAASSILLPMHGDGWIAVGEAGVAFDPLTGRGIVAAIRSGLEAARAVHRKLDGDGLALARWTSDQRMRFEQYLREQEQVYGWERRWRDAPFWRRRQPVPAPESTRRPDSEIPASGPRNTESACFPPTSPTDLTHEQTRSAPHDD